MKKAIKIILHILFIMFIAFLLAGAIYSKVEFKYEGAEEYFFYATNGIGDSDFSMVFYAIQHYGWIFLVFVLSSVFLMYNPFRIKENDCYPIKAFTEHRVFWTVLSFLVVLGISQHLMGVDEYIMNNFNKSKIIDKNYVQVTKDDIKFKKNKKNLVMIFIESLETTFIDKENGGDWDYNVIPEFDNIRKLDEAVYFSSNGKGKGTLNLYGTTYTTASVISNNATIPFKIPIMHNTYNNKTFLNQVYTLGDALKDNGYHNEVISGAPLSFGALDYFFEKHGNYDIIDPSTIDKYKYKLDEDDKGKWGFNDKYLFEIAEDRIEKLAKEKKPFNVTLIAIDSHPIDGFKGSYTLDKFKNQYENVYATDSKLTGDFIEWFKGKDYYKNTVIVIVGDHLCMQTNLVDEHLLENRGRYNVILNSSADADDKGNRKFSAVDTTPTVLAAMGATIKGNKMGLGVNLFSEHQTLIERYDLEYVNKELAKQSKLYNDLITKK